MDTRRLKNVAIVLVALLTSPFVRAIAQTTLETKLKAAIISKFPQFVEWPAAALANRSSLDVCVPNGDPIQHDLEELLAGDLVEGRPFRVRTVDRNEDVDRCHVVFLSSKSLAARRAWLRHASRLPILTVSDDPGFLDENGIVRLRQIDGRIRFDINADAAGRAGLRISSQLLELAVQVRSGRP